MKCHSKDHRQTDRQTEKLVGDWISTPRPNFVAMATRVGREVQWIADFPQAELPCRERNHGWRRSNVALSLAILGVRGPKSTRKPSWRQGYALIPRWRQFQDGRQSPYLILSIRKYRHSRVKTTHRREGRLKNATSHPLRCGRVTNRDFSATTT